MPYYESVFIARQDVSAAQVDGLADTFSELIGQHGGRVTKREYWGLKNLSYRIKKNRKGHYVLFNIDAPSDAVQEFERNLRIHEDILRYLTIRMDELDEGPSAMMQGRTRERAARERRERDDRGGPGHRERRDRDDRGASGQRERRDRDDRGASGEGAAPRDDTKKEGAAPRDDTKKEEG
jgi:small subunit ribosomal protein S6